MLGVARPRRGELGPQLRQRALRHIGQHQILIVGGPNHSEADSIGEGSQGIQLLCGHVTGRLTVLLERYHHDPIAGTLCARVLCRSHAS